MADVVTVVQKSAFASKTVWLNVLTFLSALGVILAGVKLSAHDLEIVGAIVAAANVGLRLITGAPVTDAGAAAAAPKAGQP